uniref:hypothetical protein n=1 Tax=Faecalibacterium sp. TaxID=1971605 RepID=UPI0040265E23
TPITSSEASVVFKYQVFGGNSGAIPGAENARRRAWFCAENCGIWPLVSVREGQKRVVPGRPGRMQMLKIHEQNVDEKERKIRRK